MESTYRILRPVAETLGKTLSQQNFGKIQKQKLCNTFNKDQSIKGIIILSL